MKIVRSALVAVAAVLVGAGCGLVTQERGATGPGAAVQPLDTRTWTTYTSKLYGISVGHPSDWTEAPATRGWKLDADAKNPLSPAHDTFRSPSGAVQVSAWNVPLEPGGSIDSVADTQAWVASYCEVSGSKPCTGIEDRAVALCLEVRDCHAGLLVPFENRVQAFFSGGIYDAGAMTVVSVWSDESAPAVNPYGGSQRLLEAFLSTMQVWPASTPLDERTCYGRPGTLCQLEGLHAGPLEAGPYVVTVAGGKVHPLLPVLRVPDGFHGLPDGIGVRAGDTDAQGRVLSAWDVGSVYSHPCAAGKVAEPVGPSVADLANALAAQPLRGSPDALPVFVGGYDGLYLELSVPDGTEVTDCAGGRFDSWVEDGSDHAGRWQQMGGQVDRLWILDVDGDRITIVASHGPATTPDAVDELEGMVREVTFTSRQVLAEQGHS